MTKPLDATSCILNNSLQMLIFIYQWNWREKNIYRNCDVCSREIQRLELSFPCRPLQLKTPWCASAVPFSPVPVNPWYTLESPNKHPCTASLPNSFPLLPSFWSTKNLQTTMQFRLGNAGFNKNICPNPKFTLVSI